MNIIQQLIHHKIIAIIRGARPQDVPAIVTALHAGGIRSVEITLNSPDAIPVIAHLSRNMKDRMMVGAGTVLDASSAKAALEAGAQFIIAPCVDLSSIRLTKEWGRVSIPGAYTATEIVTAFKAGADLIKVFPASSPQYIKEIRGPLDHIPLMPTGGVNLQNIKAFQDAGAVAFGIGSALVDTKQEVTETYLEALTEQARQFVAALNN